MRLSNWNARDWRMLIALFMLAVAGAGAWLLSKWSLDGLVARAAVIGAIWPVAYFAYGALAVLAITSAGFAVVLGFKSFSIDGPGDTGAKIEGDNQ